MSGFRYPNESDHYREKRNELLEMEKDLRALTESVAQKRRELPIGGALKENYVFEKLDTSEVVKKIPFAELFGEHDTLILCSMMFGKKWDAPCPSCTSIVDAINSNTYATTRLTSLAVVGEATPQQFQKWAKERGWNEVNLVSNTEGDFLKDYAAYECDDPTMVSAINVFKKTSEGVFHFWGSELAAHPMKNGHPRHIDVIWPLWNLLDMTPEGRGKYNVPKQNYTHEFFTKNVFEDPAAGH